MPGDGWGLIHFDQLTTFFIYISEDFSRGNQSNEWDVFLFGLYWAILAVVVIELWISMTYELGTPPVQCDETAGLWEGVRSEQKTGFNWNLRGNISTSMVNIINLHTSLAKLIIFQTKKEHGHLKPAVRTLGLQAASAVQLAAIRMSLDRVSARLSWEAYDCWTWSGVTGGMCVSVEKRLRVSVLVVILTCYICYNIEIPFNQNVFFPKWFWTCGCFWASLGFSIMAIILNGEIYSVTEVCKAGLIETWWIILDFNGRS